MVPKLLYLYFYKQHNLKLYIKTSNGTTAGTNLDKNK